MLLGWSNNVATSCDCRGEKLSTASRSDTTACACTQICVYALHPCCPAARRPGVAMRRLMALLEQDRRRPYAQYLERRISRACTTVKQSSLGGGVDGDAGSVTRRKMDGERIGGSKATQRCAQDDANSRFTIHDSRFTTRDSVIAKRNNASASD